MRLLRRSTVVTYVRHAATCPHVEDESYPRCDCSKWIRWSQAGKQHRQPANTRSWVIAEGKAAAQQKILDGGPSVATSSDRATIAEKIDVFMIRKRTEGITRGTERKVRYHLTLFSDFMAQRGKIFAQDVTTSEVIDFKASWDTWKSAVTRQKAQQNIRGFVRFLGRPDLLDSLGKIKASKADLARLEPKPFTEAELGRLLAQVPVTFDAYKAPRVTALIHLQVSTGLGIRDAMQLEKSNLAGGWLRIKRQKTNKAVNQRLDPSLHAELLAVTNGNPKFVFWSGTNLPESAVALWLADLQLLMKAAGLYIRGNVSHRFRDTAVDFWLGAGWSMDEIASALGDTVTIVERHYSNLASTRMEARVAKLPVRTW